MPSIHHHLLLLSLLFIYTTADPTYPPDAAALLTFKSHADLDNHLLFRLTEPFDFCQWRGVKCAQGRVVRLSLPNSSLRGSLFSNSLSQLDQLRVLSLSNNSLSGQIPDLSPLTNLKSLLLARNSFAGNFPVSILSLRGLVLLDLSRNNFSGPIPNRVIELDRISSLRLELNRFTGSVPPLNQSTLVALDVSGNNLSGPVPPILYRFGPGSFARNPGLCGEVVNLPCESGLPFFGSSGPAGSAGPENHPALEQSVILSPVAKNHRRIGLILGFAIAVAIAIAATLLLFTAIRAKTRTKARGGDFPATKPTMPQSPAAESGEVVGGNRVHKSGRLVFSHGEAQLYSLEQLMRASAELLGRGTMGTTYKAVLDNKLIVTVKRLDGARTVGISGETFERHLDEVGALRHPNLVPVRAFFQAKGERLVVFDYHVNGSLFNLIHGSRSTRAKPLHWTSCLKIAEDMAQGLAYIHNVSKLIHGNLKSTNVLLGPDFEACLTDYGLSALADPSSHEDPDTAGYKAPEIRKLSCRANAKADVYAFGVLLLELLTGKHPSQHPFMLPTDVPEWVRGTREDDGSGGEDGQLGMLTEVACICSVTSPEQRPAMWQVLKMIQEIKESVGDHNGLSSYL